MHIDNIRIRFLFCLFYVELLNLLLLIVVCLFIVIVYKLFLLLLCPSNTCTCVLKKY